MDGGFKPMHLKSHVPRLLFKSSLPLFLLLIFIQLSSCSFLEPKKTGSFEGIDFDFDYEDYDDDIIFL